MPDVTIGYSTAHSAPVYIAPRCLTQPLALTHLIDFDTLGNWGNGLGQINRSTLHDDTPDFSHHRSRYIAVARGDTITSFKVLTSLAPFPIPGAAPSTWTLN